MNQNQLAATEDTPRKRKIRLQLKQCESMITEKNKKIRKLQKKASRYKKKIVQLNEILKELQTKDLLNSDQSTHLENVGVEDLIHRYKSNVTSNQNSNKKYSPALRTFACTVHFYSPKAYRYVRKKFQTALPHERTLKKWYQSIDAKPGFTSESFEAIKHKIASTEHKVMCNLVLDEMAIRHRIEWDGKQMHGYVDICNAAKQGDYLPEAKEALVFLATAINGSWKIPVGYFLVDGVTGSQRATLVKQCLELLHETGVHVTSLTFDGCPANISMAKDLGCSFESENLKSHFEHPVTQKPLYIFPDPCHMIKLVRNAFEANSIFLDELNQEVKWMLLKQLNVVQEDEKLHLANKLRRGHIFFKNQKMKVRLASQLFSNSVADALSFCAEIKVPGFENVEGTVVFLKIINDLFDILNSRHMAQLHYKKPLCPHNKTQVFEFLTKAELYINKLKLADGTKVINCSRKTGFIGFLTCIKSVKALYIQAVEEEASIKYLPVYKISQDHLELLFGHIRAHGGCNNNPTPRQFQAIYKKLLVKTELRDVDNGNCTSLENIAILTCSSAVENINITIDPRDRDQAADDVHELYQMAVFEDQIDTLLQNMSNFTSQVICYIAGFVIHKLFKSLKCETCISALIANDTQNENYLFIKQKDKGGLIYPANDVITICKRMEFIIKNEILNGNKIIMTTKNIKQKLTSMALPYFIGVKLFSDIEYHQYEQSPLNNHVTLLIKAVMEKYINIRLHYITKNATQKLSKRQVLNKYLLFTGQ